VLLIVLTAVLFRRAAGPSVKRDTCLLVGPSNAGKTTLLSVLCTGSTPKFGTVTSMVGLRVVQPPPSIPTLFISSLSTASLYHKTRIYLTVSSRHPHVCVCVCVCVCVRVRVLPPKHTHTKHILSLRRRRSGRAACCDCQEQRVVRLGQWLLSTFLATPDFDASCCSHTLKHARQRCLLWTLSRLTASCRTSLSFSTTRAQLCQDDQCWSSATNKTSSSGQAR
jgi:hypothetical protein